MPRSATPEPTQAPEDLLAVEVEGLVYRLDRPPSRGGKKVVVTISQGKERLVDRADLFAFRSRHTLAQLVSDTFGRQVESIMGALALLLDQAERAAAVEEKPEPVVLTPARRGAAQKLLAASDLLDRAADAMAQLGHVGEEEAKRVAYLVATSRLLGKPLSLLLLAPSASGKSAILDAVAAMLPPEDVVPMVKLTAQSLYYMGENALRNKVVMVDEYEGAAEVDLPLRLLQSRGELRLTVTVQGQAKAIVAKGPVAVMSGTTITNVDVQNSSRCVTLSLDDGPEQTRRVQAALAAGWSGERRQPLDVTPWHDAQRLLAEDPPETVVIPFAGRITFPSRTATDRRLGAQVLGLVAAHALLHRRQRQLDRHGRLVAIVNDYAAIHRLLQPVVAQDVTGLSPRAARAYRILLESKEPLDRRALSETLGWSYNTAKKALNELESQELARVDQAGPPARYRTVGRSVLGETPELTAPAALA